MKQECICRIRNIYRTIVQFEALLQQELGLNINEAMLLCLIADKAHISSGEIAYEMNLTPSNTSKVIASLEKGRFIRRKTCKDDKRCMKFCITKQGKELLQRLNCDSLQLPESLQTLSEQAEQQEQ